MKNAYQVYDNVNTTMETGIEQYKCFCSECGCPVYSDEFPSERDECPHCHAKFSKQRTMSMGTWKADLNHVGYSQAECGRDK